MTADTSQRVAFRAIDRAQSATPGEPKGDEHARQSLGGDGLDLRTTVSRCGSDVVRLLDRPLPVVSAIFGCGFGSVRARNTASVANLEADHLALRTSDETLRLAAQNAELDVDLDAWQLAFLHIGADGEDSVAVSYDSSADSNVEIVLDPEDVEALARALPRIEHDVQRPSDFLVPESPEPAVAPRDVDVDRLERHWNRRNSYDAIRRLERGFRMAREQLLERLADKWATRIGAKSVDDLVVDIGERDVPCFVETVSGGTRIGLDAETLRATHRRRRLVAHGPGGEFVFDPGRIAKAFVVRKPSRRGLQTAVEFFDARNQLQVRLRPARGAELHQRLVWRGCLPQGRVRAD